MKRLVYVAIPFMFYSMAVFLLVTLSSPGYAAVGTSSVLTPRILSLPLDLPRLITDTESVTQTLVLSQTFRAEEPGTEEPGTEEPGTEEPGTEEPGTEETELTVELRVTSPQTVTGEIGRVWVDSATVLTRSMLAVYRRYGTRGTDAEPLAVECLERGTKENFYVAFPLSKHIYTSTTFLLLLYENPNDSGQCFWGSEKKSALPVTDYYTQPVVMVQIEGPVSTPTMTPTSTPSPTDTPSPTYTSIPTNTPTSPPTLTPTDTPIPTQTPTSTETPNIQATIDAAVTSTLEAMPTPTATSTPIPTDTPTFTPTVTGSITPTTPDPTSTITPDATATYSAFAGAIQATLTALPTPTYDLAATETALALTVEAKLAEQEPTSTPTITPTSTPTINWTATAEQIRNDTLATVTAQPTPVPSATPTPTATMVTDMIRTNDQESLGASAVIDEVLVTQDRWLVVYNITSDNEWEIISVTYLPTDYYTDLTIPFEKNMPPGSTLRAILHEDNGFLRSFEFPGVDAPVEVNGVVVSSDFVLGLPEIRVGDQDGNEVVVSDVILTENGWIVLYDTVSQRVVGKTHLPIGRTIQQTVSVSGLQPGISNSLYASVHVDDGTPSVFEYPGPDVPVMSNDGEMVGTTFTFTYIDSTPTPMPAATPKPIARIVLQPTSTPQVGVPVLYSPPNQYAPPNLAPIDQDRITFQWRWTGKLQDNWGFEVRGWLPGEPHNGIHDARVTANLIPDEFGVYSLNLGVPERLKGRIWYWTVAVVELEPYQRIGVEAPPNIIIVPPASSPNQEK